MRQDATGYAGIERFPCNTTVYDGAEKLLIYDVDINAGQGQIILHLPLTSSFPEQNVSRARFEIGKIAIIAAITGIIAMGSFRVPDVALERPIAAQAVTSPPSYKESRRLAFPKVQQRREVNAHLL